MPDVHFSSSLSPFVLFVLVLAAILLSLFVYRRTVPPVAPLMKRVLILLRSLALSLALILLAEPLVSFIFRTHKPPVAFVLVDNSQSMTLEDRTESRALVLRRVLSSPEFQRVASLGVVHTVSFDAHAREVQPFSSDSFRLDGERTNIAEALTFVKNAGGNLQAVVLVSDGNATAGEDPAYEAEALGVPVFSVGVGDTTARKDLAVRAILTNEITYVGSSVPLNATVHSNGFEGERTEVSLRVGTTILARTMLTLERGTRDYTVPLSFKPERDGILQLVVEAAPLPGELTVKNNRRTVSIKVLKSKMRVLVVAGAPSPDFATIRHSLEADKNLTVQPFVERGGGTFYEGTLTSSVIKNADCVALVGFPTAASPPQALLALLEQFQEQKPLLFVLSRTVDAAKLNTLESVLPVFVRQGSSAEFESFLTVAEAQRNNELLKIENTPSTIWNSLPPLLTTQALFKMKPEAEVLATKRLATAPLDDPMLVWRNVNSARSVALLGYGLFRWRLQGTDGQRAVDQFLSNTVRWLTARDDVRRVKVHPAREMFLSTERASFSGQVYDESLQPVDDATVVVRVQSSHGEVTATLEPLGSGQYEGGFDVLDVGNYEYTADVTVAGRTLGEDRGSFTVGGLSAEFQETELNVRAMEQIAEKTGGQYFHASRLAGLPEAVARLPRFRPREVVHSSELALWSNEWMLAVIVCCFAIEWFLRKRSGMM